MAHHAARNRQRVPAFVRELSRFPRLGADKIAKLHEALGVETLEDLEAACVAGRVRTLKGMGEKTQRWILDEIRRLRAPEARRLLLPEALVVADAMRGFFARTSGAESAEAAGELRRWTESIYRPALIRGHLGPAGRHHAGRAPGACADRADFAREGALRGGVWLPEFPFACTWCRGPRS